MKHYNIKKYESPRLRFCEFEMSGFLCVSDVYPETDAIVSLQGDESDDYSGDLIF